MRTLRTIGRIALSTNLIGAGIGHFTFAREEFQAQVPPWIPLDPDTVVLASGAVELTLAALLLALPERARARFGWLLALFFVAIFPGNIAQYQYGRSDLGMDTDQKRFVRLFFQPILIILALWSSGAWAAWRNRSGANGAHVQI